MNETNRQLGRMPNFHSLIRRRPTARATLTGSAAYPALWGRVRFYQTDYGVLVVAEFGGLPKATGRCDSPVFGFHIHGGATCTGNGENPFADAGSHYDPHGCPHPDHAGDLPPVFGADGNGFSAFLTNRFTVAEVVGKTVILHAHPDDFMTQPAGNAGSRIACGEIRR